jgi:iron complex transport system substrate-binding protein
MGSSLVAVTHECDYPSEATRLPQATRSNIPPEMSSQQIDVAVSSTLEAAGSLYELDLPLLAELRPDLILTQRLCDVCAVSFDRVQDAARSLPSHPKILNLEPHSLDDILDNIGDVGKAIDCEAAALSFIQELRSRISAVHEKTRDISYRPRVLCLEWVNPPYCGGHWMKELVHLAGGKDDLANLHRPSYRIPWEKVTQFSPEVMVLTCCGFNLSRCEQERASLLQFPGVRELPAVKTGRVFATDGSSYFSRPGPRIVESLELLAHLIHPELYPAPPLSDAFSRLDVAAVETSIL